MCKCGHEKKKHCPGKVKHITYKEEARQNPLAKGVVCYSAHCLAPLCDCTNYQEES